MPNKIELSGTIVSKPEFSHKSFGETFYKFYISVLRKSGTEDILPCIISETLVSEVAENENITVFGEVRTRNYFDGTGKRKLDIFVFVTAVSEIMEYPTNSVEIDGYIVQEVQYRHTALGREIADALVASQREHYVKISDYIPCIIWGRNARRASYLQVGTHVKITGRLQSREYIKVLEDRAQETRTAYEVSVSRISVVESEENENESRSDEKL